MSQELLRKKEVILRNRSERRVHLLGRSCSAVKKSSSGYGQARIGGCVKAEAAGYVPDLGEAGRRMWFTESEVRTRSQADLGGTAASSETRPGGGQGSGTTVGQGVSQREV